MNETRGQQNQGSKIDRRDGFSVFLPSRPLPHHSPSFHPPFRRRRGGERWVSGVEGMNDRTSSRQGERIDHEVETADGRY